MIYYLFATLTPQKLKVVQLGLSATSRVVDDEQSHTLLVENTLRSSKQQRNVVSKVSIYSMENGGTFTIEEFIVLHLCM